MNADQRRHGNFEERLLHELRAFVMTQPVPVTEGPRRGRGARALAGSARRIALVGGAAAVLLAGAAAGLPFLSGGAQPAYAVTANGDGTVTVEINSLRDAAGLQRKLREAGVRAVVQYLPPGKTCRQPWYTPATSERGPSSGEIQEGVGGETRFTIDAPLPAGETLVITTQVAGAGDASGAEATTIAVAFAKGDVGVCEVIGAPSGGDPLAPLPLGSGTPQVTSSSLGG